MRRDHARRGGRLPALHYHPDAPTRFDPDRFQSVAVGSDTLVLVSAPDAAGHPVGRSHPVGRGHTRLLAYSPASGLGQILAAHQVTATESPGFAASRGDR